MDTTTEIILLKAIESKKEVIISKRNTKETLKAKKKAWKEIQETVYVETGKQYTDVQLVKHWSNIQMRIKDVLRDGKLSEPDETAIRIFEEDNPKLTQIPGGFCNSTEISTGSSHSWVRRPDHPHPVKGSRKKHVTVRWRGILRRFAPRCIKVTKKEVRAFDTEAGKGDGSEGGQM